VAGLTRRAALALSAGAAWPAAATVATGTNPRWPTPRITLVLAYPSGGITDRLAQDLAERLRRHLGVTVVPEHRAGAGGTLAMELLGRAAADGSVIALNAVTPLTLAPWLGALRYDPVRDVAPLRALVHTPLLVVGTPSLQAHDWAGMLAQARSQPAGLRWASSGVASTGHLVMEQVRFETGAALTHVPYKGGGQQLQDALGGQFEVLSTNLAAAQLLWVQQGRLKALAIGAAARQSELPALPTLAELGLPDANRWSTFGLFAPGAMPAPLRARLQQLLAEVLDADWQDFVRSQFSQPAQLQGADFAAWIGDEAKRNRRLVNEPGFVR
jgi:tripartite-type tricarboxylate transporter receptor subunit TctC